MYFCYRCRRFDTTLPNWITLYCSSLNCIKLEAVSISEGGVTIYHHIVILYQDILEMFTSFHWVLQFSSPTSVSFFLTVILYCSTSTPQHKVSCSFTYHRVCSRALNRWIGFDPPGSSWRRPLYFGSSCAGHAGRAHTHPWCAAVPGH